MLNIPDVPDAPVKAQLAANCMRIGSLGLAGLHLPGFFLSQKAAQASNIAEKYAGARGFGNAKSVIMVYLQGGPSHLDLWDPKPDVPDNIRGAFKPIETKIPGTEHRRDMPKLAQTLDKVTLIRSMSYTPNGLFNHTAAIYQMMTGYTTDKVSPRASSSRRAPGTSRTSAQHHPPQAADRADAAVRRCCRGRCRSSVVGKGGTAGFLGKAYDPYRLYPDRRRPGQDSTTSRCGRRRPAAIG